MRSRLRIIAFALFTLFAASACSPEEIALYLSSTAETRPVLSNEQLARLRACESTDNYRAVSGTGSYRGAYQFDQRTWDDLALRHFPWLAGVDPIDAEPWWQDAMARALWSERGRQPWPHCGRVV
jgi:muramidase (phage lysozyme)